ncbi:ABC transporter ATP-binding protein [Adhaeribacter pallidiroseus]|uniref:Lipid A export ATP-binding/permease protein MsbA n=1 Tax=Adhaeribacter pallidiroseus TaxID=2072847 RepID=A0A369QAT0_9BACT|nr:ABC transporter transmembrane domain-containing protein [Adhaeribacter pallidiroseus]RDC61440.1 Lipid A export ATP-binding/permease protein MsbA [Adhaeribacter pallidiroseus]
MAKRGFGGRTSSTDDSTSGKKPLNKESFQKGLRIFQYTLPYKGKFIIGLIFLALSSSTFMIFPALTGQLVDSATGAASDNGNYFLANINWIAFGLFGVILLQGIFSFFRIYFFAQVSEFAVADIRRALYSKFVVLPIPFFEQKRVGEITSRITSDVAQVQDTFSITLAELFRQLVTLIVGVILIMIISVKLSLFMLGTFPVLVLLAFVFGKRIKKLSKATQEEIGKTNVIVEETLQAINVVKAFTNELFEIARYKQSLSNAVRNALKASYFRGAFVSFIIIGLFGGVILVLWFGASLVESQQLTIGQLVQFIIYTVFIGASVGGLGDMYGKVQTSLGAADRILEILDEPEEPTIKANQPVPSLVVEGNIEYDQVAFSYPTRPDIAVLKAISFQIQSGEKVALVGPSGAGKSTIVALLMKFYNLKGGHIRIDGTDINHLNLTALRQNIGIVPQEVLLFGGTIRENIAYGKPHATEEEIIQAAKKANAYQFIQSFPEQLDTLVGERGIKLSGGQRQRIAIARAILKNPAILILDEATSSLDSESEKLVQQAMDELMKGRTSIIIAHRLSTIRKADKIMVIENGHIVEQGTHEELSLNENGLYANLLRLQFELS